MHGLMQDHPLLISTLIRHAAANHGRREIVSRLGDGSIHRTNYSAIERRARRITFIFLAKLLPQDIADLAQSCI